MPDNCRLPVRPHNHARWFRALVKIGLLVQRRGTRVSVVPSRSDTPEPSTERAVNAQRNGALDGQLISEGPLRIAPTRTDGTHVVAPPTESSWQLRQVSFRCYDCALMNQQP